MRLSRRQALRRLSALAGCALARTGAAQESATIPRRLFGLQLYSYGIRQRREPELRDPLTFLTFAGRQGFAGAQVQLGNRSAEYLAQVRTTATRQNLFAEGIVTPPFEDRDGERFEADLRAAQAAGMDVVRTALLSGRRYETFRSAEDFRQYQNRAGQALERIARLAGRVRMRVAVENHKDFRAGELAELMRRLDSEHVGVCLDTGNNIALMEDPWQVVDTLTPWTFTVHLKDMAVESAPSGFLLAEVPLGRGFLDLPRLVRRIHQAQPRARYNLEMITRNPLSIPCLDEDYWRTMSAVPGVDLARTMTLVRRHARPANQLPRIDRLEPGEQIRREEEHVTQSKEWGQQNLFRGD
jgi:sugar phosphate isomerase/epimerase